MNISCSKRLLSSWSRFLLQYIVFQSQTLWRHQITNSCGVFCSLSLVTPLGPFLNSIQKRYLESVTLNDFFLDRTVLVKSAVTLSETSTFDIHCITIGDKKTSVKKGCRLLADYKNKNRYNPCKGSSRLTLFQDYRLLYQ